jgi:predicted acetyltransferase
MHLVRPSMEWENEHRAYVAEWGLERLIPSGFNIEEFGSYEVYLQELSIREKGHGKWLPCSNYFLVNEENRILGMLDIRHELNDFLYRIGGHIGYSVRPSERRRGYATYILAEALHKCRELGMDKVLITCDEDNIGSAKVIMNNGGIEDYSETDADGIVKRRFWINL